MWVALAAMTIAPETGSPYLFVQYRDITEHRRDRDALAHQAVHDPLTGLFNRTLLLDRLATALARGDAVGVILLDLDQFKLVNDSLGHQAGDEVLIAIAARLAAVTNATDTLARLGGDEFVVLCERLSGPLDAVDRAGRLAAALTVPLELASGATPSPRASASRRRTGRLKPPAPCSATPTQPCTAPRRAAAAISSSSTGRCATRRWPGSSSSATSGSPSSAGSSSSSTSRSSTHRICSRSRSRR